MANQDTNDFVTAFVIGAVVGVGATLLLRPSPPTARERVLKEIAPYRKRMGKSAKRARKGLSRSADAAGDWTQELADAGRQILSEFRHEVADAVADARDELADAVAEQVKTARKGVRRSKKRMPWR